ncbi:hypothetical protein Cgig2_011987 [Carnegiea gigantea]|uniref:Uncharacterized protein n=1 Tax=Carnegiea gigantea TaxID=171969 RepID=A0A9Q1GVU0_9CARY|nr:hypothetical protein Cgig2_011987 [Carnegiea gigantea]
MSPHGHDDESDSEDEVLVKRIKKIKQASKPKSKQIQMRSKKCARAQAEKERQAIQKNPKSPIKHGQLSVLFVAMIENFNEAKRQATCDIGFGGFLQLQVTKLLGDLCKWLVDHFDRYSVMLYISADKKIKIPPIDVHLTLALLINGRKIKEFYGKKPKNSKYNEVLPAWRNEWNLQDGTPKLSQMPQYILSHADIWERKKNCCPVKTNGPKCDQGKSERKYSDSSQTLINSQND